MGLDRATLLRRDLVPFKVAFQAGAPAVVLSHSFFAAFDPVTPASQTRAIATGLLRGRLGFEGVAITDDLAAGAVRALGPVRDAAVASLLAGADLLLIERPGADPGRDPGLPSSPRSATARSRPRASTRPPAACSR